MTIFEFAVTYAVCWWLVLFMVLPHRAEPPAVPGAGHAPSAPANPQIGRKIRWTTLIAIIPAVALYFIVDAAHGETLYHAGNGCAPVATTMAPDVAAKEGTGANGKQVAPATIGGNSTMGMDKDGKVNIPLWLPSSKYTDPNTHNVDLSASYINPGTVSVGQDGSATLDGKSIVPQNSAPEGCAHGTDSIESTK